MLIIVALVLGVFISYTFIGFQTNKYNYSADFSFIMFKFKILLSTIALGYFLTIFSGFYNKFPLIGNLINAVLNIVMIDWVRALIAFVSSIWIIFALAMLPYNHTVFNTEDNSINKDRTDKIREMHKLVYGTPFYVLFIIFSINLFFFIISLCVRNDGDEEMSAWVDNPEGTTFDYPPIKKLVNNFKNINPSFGFHFYVAEESSKPGLWGNMFQFRRNNNSSGD